MVLVLASGWARCGPLVKEQIAVQVPNKRTYYPSVYAVHEVVATNWPRFLALGWREFCFGRERWWNFFDAGSWFELETAAKCTVKMNARFQPFPCINMRELCDRHGSKVPL